MFLRALYVLVSPQLFEATPFIQMTTLRCREVWSLAERDSDFGNLSGAHALSSPRCCLMRKVVCSVGGPTRGGQKPPPSVLSLPHTPSSDGQTAGRQTAGFGLAAGTVVRIAPQPSPSPWSSSYGELT